MGSPALFPSWPTSRVPAISGAGAKVLVAPAPALFSSSAPRELEARDSRMPWPGVGRRSRREVVLVHVPERAVVDRIDRHVGVVAPARVRRRLDTRTVDDRAFAQRHLPERVAGKAARVADAGIDGRPVDDAVPETHVALLVLGDASHPAVDAVAWCVRALLVQAVRPACPPDLVPALAGDPWGRLDRLAGDQRLVILEAAVGEPECR